MELMMVLGGAWIAAAAAVTVALSHAAHGESGFQIEAPRPALGQF